MFSINNVLFLVGIYFFQSYMHKVLFTGGYSENSCIERGGISFFGGRTVFSYSGPLSFGPWASVPLRILLNALCKTKRQLISETT